MFSATTWASSVVRYSTPSSAARPREWMPQHRYPFTSAGSSTGIFHSCRPVTGLMATVCECDAMYMTPPISKGWLDALAELSRLRFHTGVNLPTLAAVSWLNALWRCCAQPMP